MVGRLSDALALPDGEMRGGQVLGGRYRLDECLQSFGEIALWAGWDETLSRSVAIYIVPPNHPATDALLGAARRAAVALDPRFLRVLDALPYGPSEPVTFVVCENLAGVTLQQLLRRGPLPGLDAAWVTAELASALAPMHEIGLGHGELNPTTVLVTASGKVRIGGFLLLSVLMGDRFADPQSTERDDVLAMGRLLYAMSTGTWPQEPAAPDTFGLPSARRKGDELASPATVRPGLPPGLDAACMQTLQLRPDAAPLRSATAVAVALRRVLGTVDASQDLADLVASYVSGDQSDDESDGVQTTNDVLRGARPLARDPASGREVMAESAGTPAAPVTGGSAPIGESSKPVAVQPPPVPFVDPGLPRAPRMARGLSRRLPHWWRTGALVAGLMIVLLVVALIIRSCGGTSPAPSPSPEPLGIVAVTEFDPVADGGDTKEHPDQLPAVTDGIPATCWWTETYGTGYLPAKKPGVGLMLDFSEAKTISSLTLTFASTPVGLSVMLPQGDAAKIDTAPMTSVTDWTSVLDATITDIPQTLTLPEQTTSRFVMLYFTQLPPFAGQDGYSQAGVCDVTALGHAVP